LSVSDTKELAPSENNRISPIWRPK